MITETAKNYATNPPKQSIDCSLNRNPSLLEEYILYEYSKPIGRKRIYLMQEPPKLESLTDKIKANIQVRKNNIIRKIK